MGRCRCTFVRSRRSAAETFRKPNGAIGRVDADRSHFVRINWSSLIMRVRGCARRGASGALNPQPAVAGLNPHPRSSASWSGPYRAAMMVWSCAAATCEPRQVRKEATVNDSRWVPQGHRAVARQCGAARSDEIDGGCTVTEFHSSRPRAIHRAGSIH